MQGPIQHGSPEGLNRRKLLAGAAGFSLLSALGGAGLFAQGAVQGPRAPHHAPKAKRVIYLHMVGGPSQMDLFDYKPELERLAGQPLPEGKKFTNSGGRKVGFLTPSFRPFRPGGNSGLMISDFFENVRGHADKLAVIRSCHTDSHAHGSALVPRSQFSDFARMRAVLVLPTPRGPTSR